MGSILDILILIFVKCNEFVSYPAACMQIIRQQEKDRDVHLDYLSSL